MTFEIEHRDKKDNATSGGQIGGQIGGAIGGAMDELTDRQKEVLDIINHDNKVGYRTIAIQLNINESAVLKHLEILKNKGYIERIGGTRGYWFEVQNKKNNTSSSGQIGGAIGGAIGSAIDGAIGGAMDELTDRQKEVLDIINYDNKVGYRTIAIQLNINESAVSKHLEILKNKGYIERIGGTRGYWKINTSNKN